MNSVLGANLGELRLVGSVGFSKFCSAACKKFLYSRRRRRKQHTGRLLTNILEGVNGAASRDPRDVFLAVGLT